MDFAFNFYLKQIKHKTLEKVLLTESSVISTNNTDLLFELIKLGFELNKKDFVVSINMDNSDLGYSISHRTLKVLNYLLSLFPRVSNNYIQKIGPVLYVSYLILLDKSLVIQEVN